MKKISFYTLGCKVNQYETQALKEIFEKNGYENVGENEFAHVYIVNSCSVTGISDRKTRQYLRRTKKLNPSAITALIGCYAETGRESIEKIDEVDIILGNAEKSHVYEEVENMMSSMELNETGNDSSQRIIRVGGVNTQSEYDDYGIVSGMDSRTRAYIKIEDGCDRFCSYCVIPYARGPVRSRPQDSILSEARLLIEKGYKELIITGINAALYGTDINSDNKFSADLIELIKNISDLPGDFRIRLSSLEPTVINAEYAARLIEIEKLCPHLHLSLQSGSNKILKAMGRPYTREDYLNIVRILKAKDPNFSITTDIIVGFPGENEEDFLDSLSMVEEAGFSKVHVFKYSKRPGTKAADMPNQIPGQIKNERSRILIEKAEAEAQAFLSRNKDTEREALVLGYDSHKNSYRAITDNDIEVEIKTTEDIQNIFVHVLI